MHIVVFSEWYEVEDKETRNNLRQVENDDDELEKCDNQTAFVEETFEVFDLLKYGFQYNNMEDWTEIRHVISSLFHFIAPKVVV